MLDELKNQKMKIYIVLGIILTVMFSGFGFQACNSAANTELTFTYSIQRNGKLWARNNPQLSLNEETVVCTPRSFGNRWPTDYHQCHALSKVINPMIGAQTITFLCNQQGCMSITQQQTTY